MNNHKQQKNRVFKSKFELKKSIATLLACSAIALPIVADAQLSPQSLPAASNTSKAFSSGSIARDSQIDQPLDLLNDFYPSITVTIADHDNVRRRPDLDEDDLKITVAPQLAYRTNLGRHQFYAQYQGIFTYHDDLDQEDSSGHRLDAQIGFDVSQRWDLNIYGGIGRTFEERGISGARSFNQLILVEDTGPDEIDSDVIGFDLIYGRKSSRLSAVAGLERQSSEYTNNVQGDGNFFSNRDRVSDSLHFDLNYQLGSKTSIFGRVQYTEIDYDRELNNLDSDQTDFLIGLRWRPTNSLSGAIGIGTSERDFADPTIADYDDGSTYYANLNYAINPFSNIRLNASKVVEEPGDADANYYESALFGLGWNHAITPLLNFDVYAKWTDDDYDTDRNDEFFDWGVGLNYAWKRWLTAGVYYGEIEKESTLIGTDYEDSFFGIKLQSNLNALINSRRDNIQEPESFDYPNPSDR